MMRVEVRELRRLDVVWGEKHNFGVVGWVQFGAIGVESASVR